MTLQEPAVALTDFGLAVECGLFAGLLGRSRAPRRAAWVAFFLLAGAAAALGGVSHGLPPAPGPARDALWTLTLLAIGLAGLQAFRIAASMWLTPRAASAARWLGGLAFAGWLVALALGQTRFWMAIVAYLPATLLLGAAFARDALRGRPGAASGASGVALTLVAAAVQQARVALHPVYFDHNALYHVVQAAGLFLIFRGARHAPGAAGVAR